MDQMDGNVREPADAKVDAEAAPLPPLAKLSLLYESDDKLICLFEDAEGHLVVTPSSYLA